MKYLLLLAFPLILLGCKSDTAADNPPPPDTTSSQPAPDTRPQAAVEGQIDVGTFTDWSGSLDGSCWCLLQLDPGEEDTYCFAFGRDGVAGKMQLDGQREVLRRGATVSPSGSDDYLSFLHENGRYRIQTSLNNEGSAQEGSIHYSGELRILRKSDGATTTANVSGSCGC